MLTSILSELTCGSDERAIDAVRKITSFGKEAVPQLATLLSAEEPDTRWWATCALSEIDHPDIIPYLRQSLHDPDLSVRQCAATGIRLHPDPVLIPDLIASMKTPSLLLTRLAANALVAIGAEAVPSLIEVMKNGPQAARVEATKALVGIKDPRSIEAFLFALQNGDSPLVEYWADEGLERLGVGMTFYKPE